MSFLDIFSSNKKIKFLICLVLPLLIIFFIHKSYSLNIYKFFDKSLISLGFVLKETKVEGLVSLTEKDIIDKIVYNNCFNLFCVNLKETKSSIKELDWIKKVKISLILPTSLKISIEEQKPKYIFVEKNIFKILNSDGKLITKVDRVKEKYKRLLFLSGKRASEKIKELSFILSGSPKLAKKITGAKLISDRRWALVYMSNIEIELPEKNAKETFRKIEEIHKKYGLLSNRLKKIDLRIKDRMIIKLKMNEVVIRESKI